MWSLDPDREAELLANEVFSRLDLNGDGTLSVEELSSALAALGLSESQCTDQCRKIMRKSTMDRAAFVKFCRKRIRIMHKLFEEIDTKNTQSISYASIRQALRRVGLEADQEKIHRLIDMVDKDGDHKISFDEFYSALMILPSVSVDDLFQYWDRASLCDLGESSAMVPQRKSRIVSPSNSFIAGGVAGIISRTMTAPLDRLKLILQAETSPLRSRITLYNSFKKMTLEGGLTGLFRGNFANVIKVAPENAIKMWAFDALGGFNDADRRSPIHQFTVGAIAGTVSQTVVYPLETIKTHFALSRKDQYKSLSDCASSIFAGRGVRGFYKGLTAATMGIVPYAGVDLSLFAFFRKTWESRYPHRNPSALQLLGFGAISSTCGQLVAYPFQLIRTRLQCQGMPGRDVIYQGMADCFRKTIESDGLKGLYRGLQPNFLKALPSISISYAIYDNMYRYLEANDADSHDRDRH